MTTYVLKINERLIEAWNSHDTEKFLSYCDDGIILSINNVASETFKGKSEVREFFNNWKRAFPDVNLTVRNKFASENQVAVEYEFSGTHDGVLRTRTDLHEFSPTHKSVTVYSCYIATVKNDKVAKMMIYPDRYSLLDRLGILSEIYHEA
jgi:predicted ester cyclase